MPSLPFSFALCADDYAITPGVTAGILELIEARRLTATSALVTGSHWQEGARELRQAHEILDAGLHLNFTLGAPLTSLKHLAPRGFFPPLKELIFRAWMGFLDPQEIQAEISAQLDAFSADMDRPPDFIDGHQHIHGLPIIRDALIKELEKRGLHENIWIRVSADQSARILHRHSHILKAFMVNFVSKGHAKLITNKGFNSNDGFAGFSYFNDTHNYALEFSKYLTAPGPRHLVMCHPGYVDIELESLDPATHSRLLELSFLLSPKFEEILAEHNAHLLTGRERNTRMELA